MPAGRAKENIMFTFLAGKRTYIIAVAVAVLAGLHQLGYVSDAMSASILTFLGAGAVGSLRAAIK